jgi:hypothetical protein
MSKSYGKYLMVGMCYGNNTPFYKDRRRKVRKKNKQRIENMIAHYNPEDYDDVFDPYKIPKKDTWMEPTDGSWKSYPKELKNKLNWFGYRNVYLTKNGKRVKR